MKITRLAVSAVLILLCGFGWYSTINTLAENKNITESELAAGQTYMDQKLYQLAYRHYKSAAGDDSPEALRGELEAARAYYAEEPEEGFAMLESAYQDILKAYPQAADIWEAYAKLYLEKEDIRQAGKILQKAQNSHASSEGLDKMREDLFYLFRTVGYRYDEISPAAFGGYFCGRTWDGSALVSELGEEAFKREGGFFGPVGEGGMAAWCDESGELTVYSPDGVKRARFKADAEEMRGPGSGMTPVRLKGSASWNVYNAVGETVFTDLENVSMFQEGVAFAKPEGKPWKLVNTAGEFGKSEYEDVKLADNGAFMKKGVLLVKTGGQWRMTDTSGTPVSDFSCDEFDFDYGQPIAFRSQGKWGFVDHQGAVYLEPQFECAKSFSGGVAAVRKDGKWGFIDPHGKLVVDHQFLETGYFSSGGTCPVRSEGEEGYRLIQWIVDR